MNLDLRAKLENDLREAYCRFAVKCGKSKRNVKLPTTLGIEAAGEGLLLRVDANSVTANMQTDAAAVDTWALMLHLWLGVPHIVLDWEAPEGERGDGHFQRFLYRVAQFLRLFPEWFEVADRQKLKDCIALTSTSLKLNVASSRDGEFTPTTTSREYDFEATLIGSECFRQHFNLKAVGRQFPVGLFDGSVTAKSRIFTGGKSAIDIAGIGTDGRFFIFELKAGDNIKVGILSELLLYTSLIREAAQNPPRIQFDRESRGSCVGPKDVRECTGINAVMLVEELHPLLEHPELLPVLNRAAAAHWNHEAGVKPVCFSQAFVSRNAESKLEITDIEPALTTNA